MHTNAVIVRMRGIWRAIEALSSVLSGRVETNAKVI